MQNNSDRITKNYIFSLGYQLILIIAPIVTAPYLARTILNDGIGLYSYAYSYATYFILLGALGFIYYAQREMAKVKNDKYETSKLFWEIVILRLLAVLTSLAIYLPLAITNVFDNWTLMMILTIDVASVCLDVTFYFHGQEKFGIVMLVGALAKILNIVCIFLLVKGPNDVWKYTLSQSVFVFFNAALLWPFLIKKISFVKPTELRLFKHMKPVLFLFIPTIAISIYRTLDKTLIGLMCPGNEQNGYYENSEKIIRVALTVITSLGSVMISRNADLIKKGDNEKFMENISNAIRFVFLLSIPMIIGVFLVADQFVPFFYGDGFEPVSNLMKVYSFVFLFVGISNVLGLQYLIVCKRDFQYIISIVIGAVSNLCLNLILIPKYGAMGATIGTIAAEFIIMLMMIIFTAKDIKYLRIIGSSYKYFISGAILVGAGIGMYFLFPHRTLFMFIEILICIVLYFAVLILLRDSFMKLIFSFLKDKFRRKKVEEEQQ